MEYFLAMYYFFLGLSVAFFMNRVSPVSKLFGATVIITWPIMLPAGAILTRSIDKVYELDQSE